MGDNNIMYDDEFVSGEGEGAVHLPWHELANVGTVPLPLSDTHLPLSSNIPSHDADTARASKRKRGKEVVSSNTSAHAHDHEEIVEWEDYIYASRASSSLYDQNQVELYVYLCTSLIFFISIKLHTRTHTNSFIHSLTHSLTLLHTHTPKVFV